MDVKSITREEADAIKADMNARLIENVQTAYVGIRRSDRLPVVILNHPNGTRTLITVSEADFVDA